MVRTLLGVESHIEIQGEGAPVLLLHGWGGSAQSWLPLIRDLSENNTVIVPDFPGHGKSGRPPQPWGVPEFMQWTEALLDSLQLAKVDIVAHSFGGRITLLLASTHPERVGRIVITGGAGLRPKKTLKRRLRARGYKMLRWLYAKNWIAKLVPDIEKRRKALAQRFGSADYNALDEEMKKTFVKVVNQDLRSTLPRIQSPTLLIWGDTDDATPLYMAHIMEHEIRDAGLVVLKGGGHFAYLEKYTEFYPVVRHFLKG